MFLILLVFLWTAGGFRRVGESSEVVKGSFEGIINASKEIGLLI